jgi:hypothetical protein
MPKFLLIMLISFVVALFAEEPQYKNSLGWKSGLFYRRSLSEHYWMGLHIGGTYHNNSGSSTRSSQSVSSDTAIFSTSQAYDSSVNYSGTIRIEAGREVWKYKKAGVDVFVAGGYRLSKNRSVQSGATGNYHFNDGQNPSHSFLGIIAAEPKLWPWSRLAVGTQLGVQYTYELYKSNSTDAGSYRNVTLGSGSTSNTAYSNVNESSRTSHSIELFGDVSLYSALSVQFFF